MESILKEAWTTRDFRLESVASGPEWTTWGPRLRGFLEALDR